MQYMKIERGCVREDGKVFWRRKRGVEIWVTPEDFQAKQDASKAYREANRGKRILSGKAYRAANKDRIAASSKAYCEANKEKVAAAHRAYYLANKDKHSKLTKAYYAANKDWHNQLTRAYYAANRDKMGQWRKAHYAENKDKYLEQNARRRAREKGQTPTDVNRNLIKTFYAQSSRLSEAWSAPHIDPKFRVTFAVDHIIPLAKGGMHEPSNLQVIPSVVNIRKKDKLNYKMPSGYANAA